MRRTLLSLGLSCTVLLTACGEKSQRTTAPRLLADATSSPTSCPAPADVQSQIVGLFDSGNQTAVLSRFQNILDLLGPTSPGPDTVTARSHAIDVIGFVLQKYQQGTLVGGQSATTQSGVVGLVNAFLCTTGLPSSFLLGNLGPDGAWALIYPTTPDTTVVTGTMWAGSHVDTASVSEPSLLTITRLPDSPAPLNTQLDQYPLYYEFHVTPEGSLVKPVIVGVCQAESYTAPDPSRLRLGHNVADSIEILPLQPAPFLDCTGADVQLGSAGSPLFRFASAGWRSVRPVLASIFLPDRLMAFATSGVGGTTRNFSPFGAVDTLVEMTANSPLTQRFPVGGTVPAPPSVLLKTPAGHAYSGIGVTFGPPTGGGSVTGATATTDANGIASVGSWTLGLTAGTNLLAAAATAPYSGSGVSPNPLTFSATALPPSKVAFNAQPPSTLTAGSTMSPAVTVEIQDEDGHLVTSSSASVSLSPGSGGFTLLGTATRAAVGGIATFGDLSVTKAGSGFTLIASSGSLTRDTSSVFTVLPGAAASIAAAAGDGQTALAGTTVTTAPSVRVVDAFGNPVSGVQVTFEVQNGGAFLGAAPGATSEIHTTGADGLATVSSWTVVAGANYLLATASASGLAGNPVTFSATGTTTDQVVVSCPPSNGAGDDLSRAFYDDRYAGRVISQVDLYLSSNAPANVPTPYTIQLIAKSGGFDGTVLGTSTVTVFLRGSASQNLPTHFAFSPALSVSRNATVTFQFNVLSNPNGATLTFNTGPCGLSDSKCKSNCGIIETNDASGHLSTFRRKSCGVTIIGG